MLGHLIGTRNEAKHICTVNSLPSPVLANRDPETGEANAHLIAAAPEMLVLIEEQNHKLEQMQKTLARISNLAPSVTHGWDLEARHIARQALEESCLNK